MQGPVHAQSIERRLVLIGAGNAHLLFVRRFGMKPLPGVSVTLVNDAPTVPYSAMVPGFIAGEYRRDEVTIDLVRLCPATGVRLVSEPITRIDTASRRIHFSNRPPLGYEILSIGLGSIPMHPPGADRIRWSFALRPLGTLLGKIDLLEGQLRKSATPFRLVVVGGGASGCELMLALHKRFAGYPGFDISLLHSDAQLLPNFPAGTRRRVEAELQAQGIDIQLNARVIGANDNELLLEGNKRLPCDGVLWATNPSPPPVLRETGLALDSKGFLLVRDTLQTLSKQVVYGTGDCVSFQSYPNLPRNGVMAVRQGRVLYDNIAALFNGQRLRAFRPPKLWLSLLNTANGAAVAGYGPFTTSGRWARRLKDRIDRHWMGMFAVPRPTSGPSDTGMRCGGCGSKVPGDVLANALKRLDLTEDPRVLMGCQTGEDAAVFRTASEDSVEVQTVDYFKTFVDDPYLFGKIAALHAASDVYAMNARPFAALAIATIPYARGDIQADQLGELLAGAASSFRQLGIVLAGGHTTEGVELALGFSVTGHGNPKRLFRKEGLHEGDVLILTKPLGTGALLAAWMRGFCRANWFEEAISAMLISNKAAAEVFDQADVRGCTDITGFGLAGHLFEMLDASKLSARIDLKVVPVLTGFDDVVAAGVLSTLHVGNARVGWRIAGSTSPPAWLFDPQTSGGLIAGVSPDRALNVLQRLHDSGSPNAGIIGEVIASGTEQPVIHIS
jgi:selenide, water dikinase